mmetsp:Transcript_24562/g.58907  ORF Transcript_24562/g.58907 Transcript_24562/m.58907 type:complete len:333 (-) Transcript_24562:50-1048(-)
MECIAREEMRRCALQSVQPSCCIILGRLLHFDACGVKKSDCFGAVTFVLVCSVAASVDGMSMEESEEDQEVPQFDVKGLKKEIQRQVLRQFKKVGKAEERVRKTEARIKVLEEEKAIESKDEQVQEWQKLLLELPDLEGAAAEAVQRMTDLNELEEAAKGIKGVGSPGYEGVALAALRLDIGDKAPERPPRGAPKPKGKQPAPRKPYFIYTAEDGTEIWVGRGSRDNDELSIKLRHPSDWWMHVSGHPGSHVVIKCQDDEPPKEAMLDAAVLALEFSKGGHSSPVSVTRARNVSKRSGAPAGQVQLNGEVTTIRTNTRTEASRLERLLKTKK